MALVSGPSLSAADTSWVGKTVAIKLTKESPQGICIEGDSTKLVIESLKKAGPEGCSFKIAEGNQPGLVTFEAVSRPGHYLHHLGGGNFNLLPRADRGAQWQIAAPLQGKSGVSIQPPLVSDFYLTVTANGLKVTNKIERKKDAVFYFEERTAAPGAK